MDRKEALKISGACAIVLGACATGLFVILTALGHSSRVVVESTLAIDAAVAAIIDSNLAAIDELQRRLSRLQPHIVTLPNVAHAIGAFGSDHELAVNGQSVRTLEWLLEEASHKPLIGGHPAVVQGVAGWQFRRPGRIAEHGLYEAHMAQVLFYLSEVMQDADGVSVDVPTGESVPLRDLVVALQGEIHGIGIDTSYALPVLFRWSNPRGWTNRFGEHWDAARLLELHLQREPVEHFCGGAHWCYALAFALRGHHDQQLPAAIRRAARARLDDIFRDAIHSIGDDGEIHWSLQGRGSAVSHQAHTLEWILLAVDRQVFMRTPALHLAVEWLILQADWKFDSLSFREFSHVARALCMYKRRVVDIRGW
jgi:hypothetical protein